MFNPSENPSDIVFPAGLSTSSSISYRSKTQQRRHLKKLIWFFHDSPAILIAVETEEWESNFRQIKGCLVFGNLTSSRRKKLVINLEEIVFGFRECLCHDFDFLFYEISKGNSWIVKSIRQLRNICEELLGNLSNSPEN